MSRKEHAVTYIDGFVIACPKANKDKFIAHAKFGDSVFIDLGATRIVECWGDDVPEGKTTDFRMAVKAEADEEVVFSWIEWPDKMTRDAAMATMISPDFKDPRMDSEKNPMPFDAKRMIFGGFAPVVEERWSDGGLGYVDGFIGPVPERSKDAYTRMSAEMATVYRDEGALFDLENWGDDVPDGKVTDFRRASKAEAGESIAFAFVGWPDKATRAAAWVKMMEMPPPADMPFDGKRVFFGGFEPVVILEK